MIGTAALWLIGKGVPEKFARPLVFLGAALALLALVSLAWKCSVDSAVDQREAEQRAANAEQARTADNNSAGQARADDARNRAERDELERITGDEIDRPLTDSERALLRCLRLQQSARANGSPAPAC